MLLAEFGSNFNGKPDLFSDKDLLIIGSNWNEIKKTELNLKHIGYSITSFKLDKAIYLSKQGSLFFKHILNESIILSDNNNIFNKLFLSWRAKNNYEQEIISNLELLELTNYLPKSKYTNNYLNDLIIISIRNILIRKIASHGVYIFDWENIFKISVIYGYITYKDIYILKISRRLKNIYRNNIYIKISNEIIHKLLSILNKISQQKFSLKYISKKEILLLPEKFQDGSYKQLRALEALCCYYSFDKTLKNYISFIKNPNYSCATNALSNA